MPKRYIPRATTPRCALLSFGIQNAKPIMSRKIAISGKVVSSKFLRPNVSIVFTAGSANTKFTAPNPKLARNAWVLEKFACVKMFVE